MTLALLTAWKEDNPCDFFGALVADEDFNYIVDVFEKDENPFRVILEIFSQNFEFECGTMYVTYLPTDELIKAAQAKGIKRVVYISDKLLNSEDFENFKLEPFVMTFGKVIDMLSQYKPVIPSIHIKYDKL